MLTDRQKIQLTGLSETKSMIEHYGIKQAVNMGIGGFLIDGWTDSSEVERRRSLLRALKAIVKGLESSDEDILQDAKHSKEVVALVAVEFPKVKASLEEISSRAAHAFMDSGVSREALELAMLANNILKQLPSESFADEEEEKFIKLTQ